jgi:uncharacterized protein
VILVDANILLYAALPTLPQHEQAHDWLNARLNGTSRVALPWASLLAFLRISTNPRAFARPVPPLDAWKVVRQWIEAEPAWIPEPTARHGKVLEQLLALPGIRGDLVPDAHLAALAMEHGLMLCSADADFARFPGLRWMNPLYR